MVSGIKDSDLKELAVDCDNKGVIYVSSAKTLYRTEDGGSSWLAVFSARVSDDAINFVGVSGQAVYVCTKSGVFRSSDGKSDWQNIFKGIGDKENNVAHIAFLKDKKIYLATEGGLFISNDGGLKWSKDNLAGGGSDVKWIGFLDEAMFVASGKGVYKNSGSGWKRTFVTTREDAEHDADIKDESQEAIKPVNSIAVNNDSIFLATDSGIFISVDKGETWKSFINSSLISIRVKRILSADSFYAVTDKGVFIFSDKDKLWESLYKGMPTKDVNSMVLDSEGNIWAATKKGLYKLPQNGELEPVMETGLENKKQDILNFFNNEPAIKEIQKAAIEYAEVHPDKIREWRNSANKKALLPNVSVGLDRYVTDYWHWDSGTNPDTLQRGKDTVSWDVTMTWDMGELIWNTDQTSIDTRSKLMVELRGDIMSEVTRIYFERRRLQIDLLASPPKDLKISLEKELRLQELTADIDALTGGYLSKSIEE